MTGLPVPKNILAPQTEKQLFVETILKKVAKGENLTLYWVAHGGKETAMRYLADNQSSFGLGLLGKSLIIYLDPDEVPGDTPTAYFQLMLSALDQKGIQPPKRNTIAYPVDQPFFILKEAVRCSVEDGWHLVFIINAIDTLDFPTSFFDNLKSLWDIDKLKVSYIFTSSKDLAKPGILEKYGKLKEAICQNFVYIPLYGPEDTDFIIARVCAKYGYTLTPSRRELVKRLGGGHPYLVKSLGRIINGGLSHEDEQTLIAPLCENDEINLICQDIWQSLENDEQNAVKSISQGIRLSPAEIPARLLKMKIVTTAKGSSQLFSSLFHEYLKQKTKPTQNITYNQDTNQLLVNNQPGKEKFTLQEYHLLTLFLERPGIIHSRDEVAKTLWGTDFSEKYSDWAIDQAISALRKKLAKLNIPSANLQTIRKRGYRWLAE